MKVTVSVTLLWVLGMAIAHIMFAGLSAKIGYGIIFSWWFVTYFSYLFKSIRIIDIAASFSISIILLAAVYFLGWYGYLYHGVPHSFSIAFATIIALHGSIVTSPLVFNKVVKLLIDKFS